jgi:hypothetical protein
MSLASEAHLLADRRSVAFVRYLPGKRRNWKGWVIFLAVIALNEARGTYVVAQILAQALKHYHGG